MNLLQVLEEFGLTRREARAYLAALQLGEASIQDIALQAGIERTGTYYLIESLVKEGIVGTIKKDNKTYYIAAEPAVILDKAKRKKELIEKHFGEFEALYNNSSSKPKVRLYEGMEGIKTVFDRTLKLKKGEEILAFSSFDVAHQFISDWGHDYVKRRVAKGISARDIAEDSPEAREHQSRDKEELRETKLVTDQKFPFTNEIDILDDWIMIVSYKETIALAIESQDVTNMFKAIFELAWLGANK